MSDTRKTFLPHLAGLRGWAIMAVVLFHLNSAYWSQGYLGVDVFLVITGYLLFRSRISSSEIESIADGARFLWRRACRLVPPMCILIVLAVGVGAVLLHPEDETFVSRVGYQACLAKVNVFLGREMSNYFASDSQFNPLLHLWYLAVTLQVYLMWAVGTQLVQRLPRYAAIAACVLVGAGSYVWAQVGEASYYSTLPRVWEVLAGGLVYLLPELKTRRIWASVFTGVGFLAIIISALALVPACTAVVVAGSVLVLRYAPASYMAVLLSNALLVWLGRISFSLYLVHMPLIAFCHLWLFGSASVWQDVLIVAAAVIMGWGYYFLVEKRRPAWWGVLVLWGATLLSCRYGYKTKGFEKYIDLPTKVGECAPYQQWQLCQDPDLGADWPAELTPYDGIFNYILQLKKKPPVPKVALLAMGDPRVKPSIALLGDSYATHLYAGLDTMLHKTNRSGVYLMPIILPFEHWEVKRRAGYTYDAPREKALFAWLEAHPELRYIVIGQHWMWRFTSPTKVTDEQYTRALRAFLQKLHYMGRKVVVVTPTPRYLDSGTPKHYYRISALRGKWPMSAICSMELQVKLNARVMPILHRMEAEGLCSLLDPLSAFDARKAEAGDEDKHRVHMVDTNHLSPEGSIWMMERIFPRLKALLECD